MPLECEWHLARKRWAENLDILKNSQWRQDAELRASGRQRALGPQWPTVEQPSQDEKEVLLSQYSSLSPSPAHLSHTTTFTLSRIKCEIFYFYKEACSFVYWSSSLLLTMLLLIFVYDYEYTALKLWPIIGFQLDRFLHECSIFVVIIGSIHPPCNRGVATFSYVAPNNSPCFQ